MMAVTGNEQVITCDCCGQPMKLDHTFKKGKSKRLPNTYRKRRFKCELCDLTKMIFADGNHDEKVEPGNALDDVNEMYKQQSENNSL